MSNVSFGIMTPKASQAAQDQIYGIKLAEKLFGSDKRTQKMLKEAEDAFKKANEDPDYLFEENPGFCADEESLKKGQLELKDKNAFLLYKLGKNDEKYYLGKFEMLQDACKFADRIKRIIKNYNKECCAGTERVIAVNICNSDKSVDFHDAVETGKKILAEV